MDGETFEVLQDEVGLLAGVALLVGTALGMSIFIVPTQMLAQAGPSIVLAVLASIVPMILATLMLLQLGSALPVAGGVYVYASRIVGSAWGVLAVILMPLLTVWAYLVFAALGFAQYLPVLVGVLPLEVQISTVGGAWLLLLAFLVINYVGVEVVARVQIAMVSVLLLGIGIVIVGGLLNFDRSLLVPLFPAGPGEPFEAGLTPFFLAIVLLYIPFQGFSMIIELGEDLENPGTTMPQVLGIGMGLVTVLVVGLILALAGSVPWESAIDPETGAPVEGGLAVVLAGLLPDWSILLIAISALIAAATTVNTMLTSFSRTLMRAARDDVLPRQVAGLHDRFHTPTTALLVLSVPPLLIVPLHRWADQVLAVEFLDWLVVIVVTGIFTSFMIASVALWRLPSQYPTRYEKAWFTLSKPVLKVVSVGNVVASLFFMGMVARTAPSALLVVGLAVSLGFGLYYAWRRLTGVQPATNMQTLHSHEL